MNPSQGNERCLEDIESKFLCRKKEIKELVDHLEAPVVSPDPLCVTGPESTGKTSIVKETLRVLKCMHVYIDCVEFSTSMAIYGAIVRKLSKQVSAAGLHQDGNQQGGLRGKKRARHSNRVQGNANMSHFVTMVVDVIESGCVGEKVWIVLDHVERVQKDDMLPLIHSLSEFASLDIGLIFISKIPWYSGVYSSGSRGKKIMKHPDVLEFPAYTTDQLIEICLAHGCGGKYKQYKAYFQQFLNVIVHTLGRATANLMDVRTVVGKLWPLYISPVKKQGLKMQHTQLMHKVMPHLKQIVSELDIGTNDSWDGENADTEQHRVLLGIPYISKYILLASYLASRNKATTDKSVFDPGYSGKRLRGSQALDRQVEKALEMKLRGSHPFPLERMLHIFYYIYDGPQEDMGISSIERADVLMQVTSMCALGWLSFCGTDPLTSPMYRCNLSDDTAYLIAKVAKVRLHDYLKLA